MSNTALGAALTIDDSVLTKIQEAENKIIRLEQTTRTSADKIAKSFRSAGDVGIQYFIDKLKLAQTELSKIDFSKLNVNNSALGNASQQFTAMASDITKAATSMNMLAERAYSTTMKLSELYKERDKLNKQLKEGKGLSLDDGSQQAVVNRLEEVKLLIKEQLKGKKQLADESQKATQKEQESENKRYQNWLAQKDAELKEHIRVENEKFRRTKAIIDEQLKMFAELEKKKAEWANQNTSAKSSGDRVNKENREQEKAYERLFDKVDELERKKRETKLREEQKTDEEVYKRWLARKHVELQEHIRVENEKYKRTKTIIDEQLKMFNELEKKKATWAEMNASAKGSGERVNREIREQEKAYERMFDEIARRQKQQAEEAIALAKRQYAEQAKLYQQQNLKQNTTYQGALKFAEDANTINRRTKAIQYLTQARAQLSTTDANYAQKLKALNDAIKRMNAENEKAVQGARTLAQQHSNLMNTSDQLARKLALIFSVSQIQGYVNKLIQVRGEFELQNTALASILQNKGQADKLFGQITELAIRSPFTVKELTTYTKSLAAYQVQYEDLYDTTKMLADVSAGLGVDMQRLILAFGQVKAANFLRGTETRQFTEAGINMLGELAKYYTELEGRIVSVAEVQERQFKRMISFADVEQVFKRLTSAGGMFYQMQEKQAETLKGMVSNLQDSIDIMFNSIGEANDGTLKNMVSLVKSIVDKWEFFANVLNASAVGFVAYATKIVTAAVSTKAFSLANLEATATAKGLNAVLAKSILMLKNLAVWLKANPFTLWATGVAFAAYAIADHVKKVQKAREEYDILSRSVQSSKKEIEGIKSRLDAANTSVLENNNIVSKLKQGTEEYKDAQEKLTKAQSEQQIVLDELKSKYPEIYNGLVKQKDGTMDMTEAQKAYNDELERTMTLNVLMRQGEGFFSDGIFQDFQDLSTSQKEYENQTRNLEASYNAAKIMIETLAKTSDKFYKQSYADAKKVIDSTDDLATKMQKLNRIAKMSDVWFGDISSLRKTLKDATEGYSDAFRSFSSDSARATDEVNRLIDNVLALVNVPTDDAFKGLEDSAKQSAKRTAEEFIKSIPTIKDKFIQEFVNKQLNVRLGFTIDFSGETQKELSAWQKRINEYIDKNGIDVRLKIKATDTTSAYFDNLRSQLKETQTEISKLQKATEQRGESGASNEAQIKSYQEEEKTIKQLLSAFGELETKEKKGKDTTSQVFKDRLSFFERANKEYEKLQQNYSRDEAWSKVLTSMWDESKQLKVDKIFRFADFDEQGTLESFNKVKAMYRKLSDEMSLEFAKRFGGVQLEMEIDVREDRVKAIQDQFSDLFGNYELSLELDKLGLDRNLMSDLFDVDTFTLDEVRAKIDEFWIEQANKQAQETAKAKGLSAAIYINAYDAVASLGLKAEEEYKAQQKRITDAEAKELEERLKRYAEYLKKSVSERVRIEQDAQKEIAKVQETKQLTTEQKVQVTAAISKETNEKLASLAFKEFKGADLYTKVFDDLERAGDLAITTLLQRLDEFSKTTGKNLPINEFKELVGVLKKVREEAESRDLFGTLVNGLREWEESINEVEKAEQDLKTIINGGSAYSTYVDENGKIVTAMLTRAKAEENLIKAQDKQKNAQTKVVNSTKSIQQAYSQVADSISSALSQFQEFAESMGAELSPEMQGLIDGMAKGFSLVATALGVVTTAMIAATTAGAALMTVLWPLLAIGAAIGAIFAISAIHDNKRQAIIEQEQENVERLQIAYEDLQRTVEKGLSLSQYASNSKMVANLQQQIESYNRMIAAEKDKKKSDDDQIKQWEAEIKDLTNQIADTYDNLRENLVGNFKSLSEELGDAIVSAFAEGENAAAKWGETVDDIIGDILKNLLIQKYLEPQLQSALDEYFEATMPKTSAAEDAYARVEEAEKLYNDIKNRETEGFEDYIKRKEDLAAAKKEWDNAISEWEKLNAAAAGEIPQITEEATNKLDKDVTGIGEDFQGVLEGLPESLRKYFEGQTGDTMTSLSKSISGITESQADALSAITESIRYFASDSNLQLRSILATLTAPAPENPFLLELKAQTEQLRTMNSLWNRIVKSENGSIALNVRIKG